MLSLLEQDVPQTISGGVAGNIMVVDDNPTNLTLLEEMLRRQGYEVRSLPRGRMAIAAAKQEQPDLILLDINMPEMNGYEVCEQMKAIPALAEIPIVFLSALNATEDKVRGFRAGGIDYISKPFQMEEVQARVETHVRLRRAQQAERELLEKTLGGAAGTLWELVQLHSPALALRSAAIRHIVSRIARRLGVREFWQNDLAAQLCLLGCVALPGDIFEKAYTGQKIAEEDERMFSAHPETASRLLSNIPRLEAVAAMIRWQLKPDAIPAGREKAREGAMILHLAQALDRKLYLGTGPREALRELKMSGRFESRLLDALEGYGPAKMEFEVRRLASRELRAGMVLRQDILSPNGVLILKEGTILNDTWIERLDNFTRARGARDLIEVETPRLDCGLQAVA